MPPVFTGTAPDDITADLVAQFEALTGRTLQPAQVERVFVDVLAYRESLVRVALQDAAEQNLLGFARGESLDLLGDLVGTPRLAAAAARATLRFTLVAVQAVSVVIPVGARVATTDGAAIFVTTESAVVAPGALTIDVPAIATAVGVAGNGYAAGTVSVLQAPIALVLGVTNVGTTFGGADVEDDERYRARVREAPARFSVAGSAAAYRFHALTVSTAIADVVVSSNAMGVVRVCVLATTGLPSAQLQAQVSAALSAETVRPLTDTVLVVPPTEVPFAIEAVVRPQVGADGAAVLAAAEAAAAAYAEDRRARLGRDIVPNQLVAALMVPGAYDVVVTQPALQAVGAEEWANCTSVTVTLGVPGA